MPAAGREPDGATQAPRTPSVIVLGSDALLAALPATPVQLAHACLQAGYQQVIPASWGDELVAQAVLRHLGERRPGAAVQCSCPLVAQRLMAAGSDLRPFLVSVVAPPVAVARYLRSVYPATGVRITYVGRCPGAVHEDIDARVTPQDLLAELATLGTVLAEQPRVFDSIVPADRRRFFSLPGGLPSAEQVWSDGGQRTLAEIGAGDVASEIAELLLSGRDVLVDPSTRLGCLCAGAAEDCSGSEARARVVALEPPRAATAVVRPVRGVELDQPLPSPAAEPREIALSVAREGRGAADNLAEPEHGSGSALPRRRSPSHGVPRPVLGGSPTARDGEGRQLPRTYVARRRSTPRPFRVQIDVSGEAVTITESTTAQAPPELIVHAESPTELPMREREVQLLVTPTDWNGDAIAADQAPPVHSTPSSPAIVVEGASAGEAPERRPAAPATAAAPAPATPSEAPASAAAPARATPSEAPITAPRAQAGPVAESEPELREPRHDETSSGRERTPVRDRESLRRESPPSGEWGRGQRVRRPLTERVVLPHERPTPLGTLRPSPRQLGVGLLLVSLVIAASVALGVVIGRWLSQPTAAAPAGAAAPRSAPQGAAPAPTRPRTSDSALIDAL